MNQIEEKWKETMRQKWEGANTGGHNAISTPVMEEILSDIENLLEQERKKYIEEGFQDGIGEFNQKSFNAGLACGIRDEKRRVVAAKKKTIGFLVLWCGSVVADDEETGCDVERQNLYLQPVRTLQESKEFVAKYLSSYEDVKIVRVTDK